MKKLFTLTVIAILTSVFFSSCGSGLSITKRRYTKGYYVNRTPKPAETKETVAAKAKNESAVPVAVQVMPEVKKESEKQTIQKQNSESKAVGIAKATPQKETARRTASKMNPIKEVFSDFSLKQPFKTIDKAIDSYKLSADSDDDGLSLFWIIILVLLILWALGFISGNFGGVVHVLLIIALVLLILWLLKVL